MHPLSERHVRVNIAAFSETHLVLGLHLEKHFLRHRALNEAGAVVGEAGADAVGLFDHGCARTVTGRRPCHLVATHMASAVAVRYPRSRSGASRESASYPARRCLTAIFRARVEGDGRLRRRTMDSVDHRFKQY